MRFDKRFCARTAVTAGLLAAAVSVFGLSPVHAQTTPARAAGGRSRPSRRMSIDDAVATALEQNLDLQVQRINPQIRDLRHGRVQGELHAELHDDRSNFVDQTQPPSSLLSGNTSQLTNGRIDLQLRRPQQTPWYGGSYQVLFNNGRTTTNNIFTSFDPQLTSNISATYTQPLLRNFKIDGTRQQLLVSQKNREISDTQLQQSIAQTVRSVRNAFYDLMYAIGNLNVQRQSLELAQQSLKDNRARVEIGTMAPLDIVQAEAEVATREEAVIVAEAAIERQQDLHPRADLQTRRRRSSGTRASSRPTRSTFAPTHGRHGCGGEERAQPAHRPRWSRARTSRRTTSHHATSTTSRCRTSMRRSTTARRRSAASACCAVRHRA